MSARAARAIGAAMALAGVGVGGALAWEGFRPISAPDALNDPLRGVLQFALLDADFSKLPVEERLKLVLDLAKRLQSMGAGDSALLAAFAAGIRGEARAQLESNVRTLGVDLMASYGEKYAAVPEAEREAFLEQTAVEWHRLMEQVTGQERNLSDQERLAEMRRQSEQDAARARERARPMSPERVSGFMEWVRSDVNGYSSPNQRAVTSRFVRDMTRHLRGRDVETNQPLRR